MALEVHPSKLTVIRPGEALLGDLRAWAGLSQPEAAARLGGPTASLGLVEQGRRPLRDELAERLAHLFGVTADEDRSAYARGRERRLRGGQ